MNTTPNETHENENITAEEIVTEVVNEQIIEETEENVAEEPAVEELEEETVALADTIAEAVAANSDATENEPKSKQGKRFAFAGLLAIILVCTTLWVAYSGIFTNKYAEIYDTSNMAALYIKDDAVFLHRNNGKIQKVSDATSANGYSAADIINGTMLRSPDGNAIFFYENFDTATYTGDLCAMYNNKNKVLVDTSVSAGLMCSADGKILIFAKRNSDEAASLYMYKKGSKPQLLTDNYTPSVSPMLSYSAKYIAYASPDAETGTNSLYIAKLSAFGSKGVKVADDVSTLYSINDNGYAYFAQTTYDEVDNAVSTLCYASRNTAPTPVAEDVTVNENCFAQLSNNFAYYLHTKDGVAQFYAAKVGKEPTLLFEDENFYLNPDVENKNYIFITIDKEDQNMLDISRINGKKLSTVAENTSANGLNNVLNSRDFNKITFMRNYDDATYSGEFFISKTFLGFKKETKIADNVSLAIGTPDLEYIAYFTDLDLTKGVGNLHLYNGKKSEQIAENVPYYSVSFSSDCKKLFYLSNVTDDYKTATLNIISTKNPTKTTIIDNEITPVNIYEFLYAGRTNGSVYYYKNYDATTGKGDLYYAKNGKNPVLVEEDIFGLVLE